MATTCYFTDKLSPELRVLIYGFVFGDCEHVKRIGTPSDGIDERDAKDERLVLMEEEEKQDMPAETAIFTVSKLVSKEALDTFYFTKTVRLTFDQLYEDKDTDYHQRLRKLQLIHCRVFTCDPLVALDTARKLPLAKSVCILSDSLAYVPELENAVTVASFFRPMKPTCIDIGVYRLAQPLDKIKVINSKVVRMWPEVASMPEDFDVYSEFQKARGGVTGFTTNCAALGAQTSLRLWVAMFEWCWKAPQPGYDHFEDDEAETKRQEMLAKWLDLMPFLRTIVRPGAGVSIVPKGRDAQVTPLHKLNRSHDAESQEWATELLAANIETFTYHTEEGGAAAKAEWPALNGGRSLALQEAEQQRMLREWQREHFFIPKPCTPGSSWFIDDIKERLLENEYSMGRVVFGEDAINAADRPELQKILYLLIAVGFWGMVLNEEGTAELDEWSRRLLTAYLSRVPALHLQNFRTASLERLRSTFRLAFAHLSGATLPLFDQITAAVRPSVPQGASDDESNHAEEDMEVQQNIYRPFVDQHGEELAKMWVYNDVLERLQVALRSRSQTENSGTESPAADTMNAGNEDTEQGWRCTVQ